MNFKHTLYQVRLFSLLFWCVLISCFVSFLLQNVCAKGTLSIQLLDYNNPRSKDYNGDCCDCCSFFGSCPNDCENFFKLTVTKYPYTVFTALSPWVRWETYIMGDDSFSFPGFGDTIGNGLTNPLIYHFNQRWPVRLVCFLFVRNYYMNCSYCGILPTQTANLKKYRVSVALWQV